MNLEERKEVEGINKEFTHFDEMSFNDKEKEAAELKELDEAYKDLCTPIEGLNEEVEDPTKLYENFIEEVNKDKNEFIKENDFMTSIEKNEMINKLEAIKNDFREKKNLKAANKAENVIKQLKNLYTLAPLKNSKFAPDKMAKFNDKEAAKKRKERIA